MKELLIPVSIGEILDKVTILEIKSARIKDSGKLANVRQELALLNGVLAGSIPELPAAAKVLMDQLRLVNQKLWDIEDDIRELEGQGNFGDRFVGLARSVYVTNDRRAVLKRELNVLLGSAIIEEKSYSAY